MRGSCEWINGGQTSGSVFKTFASAGDNMLDISAALFSRVWSLFGFKVGLWKSVDSMIVYFGVNAFRIRKSEPRI